MQTKIYITCAYETVQKLLVRSECSKKLVILGYINIRIILYTTYITIVKDCDSNFFVIYILDLLFAVYFYRIVYT